MKILGFLLLWLFISPDQEIRKVEKEYKVVEHYRSESEIPFLIVVDNGKTIEYFETDYKGNKKLAPYIVQEKYNLYKIINGEKVYWKNILID